MLLTNDQKEKIVNVGAFSYSIEKLSNIINVNLVELQKEFDNPKSECSLLLQKGKDISEYLVDLKLFELAKAGDLNAIKYFEKKHKLKKLQR